MMEATYKTRDGRLVIKVCGEDQKQLFKAIASAQEVFEAASNCGLCNSADLRFRVRTNSGFDFYELFCRQCTGRFSYGQTRDGDTLFPKLRDEEGELLPDGGWSIYRGSNSHGGVAPQYSIEPPEITDEDIPF